MTSMSVRSHQHGCAVVLQQEYTPHDCRKT